MSTIKVTPTVTVPAEPSMGRLMSMAIRYDHALGLPGYYDSVVFGARPPGTHARRLESTLVTMRQLYEEAVGLGFYRPEKEEEYAALITHTNEQEASLARRIKPLFR